MLFIPPAAKSKQLQLICAYTMMTEPHLHKSWPQCTGSCQCELPSQISVFLWYSGWSFTPPKNKSSMQYRKWPFIVTQLKTARLRTLWVQAAALTHLEVRPPQQGQDFPNPAHIQTGQGCRRPATFIVLNCCNECQDQKTKLKCCRFLEKHGLKKIQCKAPSEDNEEGGKCPQSCSTHAKQSFL